MRYRWGCGRRRVVYGGGLGGEECGEIGDLRFWWERLVV